MKSAPHRVLIVYAYDIGQLSLCYSLTLKLTQTPTLTVNVLLLIKKHDVVHFSGRPATSIQNHTPGFI